MFYVLAFIPTALTVAMFVSRNSMLGWPSAGFWMIFGVYNYLQVPAGHLGDFSDINYILFWFSCLGMVIFCALAMYGLREVKDVDAETEEESEPQDPEEYPDEAPQGTYDTDGMDGDTAPSGRTQALRNRARKRRTGETPATRKRWGAFS